MVAAQWQDSGRQAGHRSTHRQTIAKGGALPTGFVREGGGIRIGAVVRFARLLTACGEVGSATRSLSGFRSFKHQSCKTSDDGCHAIALPVCHSASTRRRIRNPRNGRTRISMK